MNGDNRSDEELGQQVGDGDHGAFAELYHRYFSGLYDFAIRVARERDLAALIVQASFLRAYQTLRTAGPQAPFKLQLYAGAHHDAAERLRGRRGPTPEAEEAFDVVDPVLGERNPALSAELSDLARTLWQACQQIQLSDYELVDLSVRRQLDVGELAAVLRTRVESVQTRLTRAQNALEDLFSSLFLVNSGRRACVDLDFLVGDGEWSSGLQRRVSRHLQSCQTCQGTRQRHMTAEELLAALTPVAAPASWEQTMLDRLLEAEPAAPAEPALVAPGPTSPPPQRVPTPLPEPAGGGGGFGDWLERVFGGGGPRVPLVAVLGGGLLLVIVILAGFCTAGAFDGDGEDGSATASPTTSPTTTGTQTTTPTLTATATSSPAPLPTATLAPPAATTVPPTAVPTAVPTSTTAPATATPPPPTATP